MPNSKKQKLSKEEKARRRLKSHTSKDMYEGEAPPKGAHSFWSRSEDGHHARRTWRQEKDYIENMAWAVALE